ncbi:MAG: 30S ribosome-binding factor RbfA [Firmicutes bacterium]|nr:30S ribosome-binding factor RbfA [Bacillota bacterium]
MSRKVEKLNSEMQRTIAAIIREIRDPRMQSGLIVTVTKVETTNDLAHSKVYISVMADAETTDRALVAITNATPMIKRELGNRIKVRSIPDLTFILDTTEAEVAAINAQLDSLLGGGAGGSCRSGGGCRGCGKH